MRQSVKCLLAVFALGALTLAVAHAPARYRVVGPAVLDIESFSGGLSGWGVVGKPVFGHDDASLRLTARGVRAPTYVIRRLPDPQRYHHLQVTAEVATVDVVSGRGAWQKARLMLLSFVPPHRKLRHWPTEVAELDGSSGWQPHSAVIPMHPDANDVWLVIYQGAESGRLMLRNLHVAGAVEEPIFVGLRYALTIAWIALWIWLALKICTISGPGGNSLQRLVAVLATALLLGGLLPAPQLSRHSAEVKGAVRDASAHYGGWLMVARKAIEEIGQGLARRRVEPDEAGRGVTPGSSDVAAPEASDPTPSSPPDAPGLDSSALADAGKRILRQLPIRVSAPDKRTHMASFFLVACVVAVAYRHIFIAIPLVGVILLAVSLQVLQSLTTTRNPDLADLRADVLGICLGTACAHVLVRLARRTLRPR